MSMIIELFLPSITNTIVSEVLMLQTYSSLNLLPQSGNLLPEFCTIYLVGTESILAMLFMPKMVRLLCTTGPLHLPFVFVRTN
jgi:hypothetical protein